MDVIQNRLQDLRTIVRGIRAAPIADVGATPELAARALPSADTPEELRDAAMDLRCGWMVRTSGTHAALAAYDELRVTGARPVGRQSAWSTPKAPGAPR